MTTLTIYFAFSAPPSQPSSSARPLQSFRTISNPIKTKPRPLPLTNIELADTSSTMSTPQTRQPSFKRTKTFFERFNHPSPTAMSQLQTDPAHPLSEPHARLRRRFTFRRSLRHAHQNKRVDIDDNI
ncbi:unnamed protein product, partial [Adineta ricciae]